MHVSGRPMIECSSCNIWIHLSCAKIRRSNIPDLFICPTCRDSHSNQIKTIVNGFDNKNNFKSMKQTKTKTKRRSSISDNKAASKAHVKDKKVEEPWILSSTKLRLYIVVLYNFVVFVYSILLWIGFGAFIILLLSFILCLMEA